jgi:large subunit ribosomal protein L4e
MSSRPVVTVHGADGAAGKDTLTLPNVFKAPIRPDIVQYAKSPISSLQYSY